MAVQVSQYQPSRPAPKQSSVERNPFGDLLTLGGTALGGYFGGVQGAAAGASLGNMVGGVVAPPTVNQAQVQTPTQGPQSVATQGDAMSRRMSEIGQGDQSMQQIANSIDSLKYIQDDDLRYKLAQPLVAADFAAMKQQGKV